MYRGVATPVCNPAIERLAMTVTTKRNSYRLDRPAGQQGSRAPLRNQGSGHEKFATGSSQVKLLRCKETKNISTFNVNTLSGEKKKGELIAMSEMFKVDVTSIQEHRIYHPDEKIQHHDMGKGWMLITSSAEKADNNATIRGVGILLSPQAYGTLLNVESINTRIMVATFNGNPKTTFVACYSPTNVSEEIQAQEFYTQLQDTIRKIPKHNVTIVAGDMNAQVGIQDTKGRSFHEETNRNGQMLLDLIKECNLVSISTKFIKKKGKLWTYTYPNKQKAHLDHILINKKWQNSALDCEAYNTMISVGSDHRPCTAKLRLSLRASKVSKTKKIPYDWSKLRTENDVQSRYSIEVKNRFAVLEKEEDTTADTMYNNIIQAHQEAAEMHVPLKPRKKKRVLWETNNIIKKREALHQTFKNDSNNSSSENKSIKQAKIDLDNAYTNEQEQYIREKINELENAHDTNKARLAWTIVNEVSGRKGTKTNQIRANSPEERIKLWKEHFQNLLGQPPVIDDQPINKVFDTLPIVTGDFTMSELQDAIKATQNNKATGLDGIPAEVWKMDCLREQLLEVCNKAYHGDVPAIWRKGAILPFPKKGDLGKTANYRGITLSPVSAKIYNRMLLNRMRPQIDSKLRINQNGFRQNRSTVAQILTLRRLIEGIKAKNLPAVLTFVDFRKAFDSIHRGKLMEILKAYGVPSEIVSAVNILYTKTSAQVLSPDGDTEFFEILAGVLQGDTLAPYLFIIALDYAMRQATEDGQNLGFTLDRSRSRRHPAKVICDTDFADDLALLSNSLEQAQELLTRLENAAKQIGLHINNSKTEYMLFNQDEGDLKALDGDVLNQVEDFQYLGAWLNTCSKDINIRIGRAWTALLKLNTIWKSNLQEDLKVQFFRATVETVLLYGSSSWTLTKALSQKIDGAYTKMLRVVKNVTWEQHVTNKVLYGKLPSITTIIEERRLRFSGHCFRSKQEVVHQLILWEPKHGRRSVGGQLRTYVDQLESDTGIPRENLANAMEDREGWRKRVMAKKVRLRSM